MAQTTWLPRYTHEQPKRWLLTDGSVVQEPPLEQTSTGRKVRVTGTNLSAFSRDLDELLIKAVKAVALNKGADVWMPIHDADRAIENKAGFDPGKTPADLYVLSPETRKKTRVWWRFRHQDLPIEALLIVEAGRVQPGYAASSHKVEGKIVTPKTEAGTQSVCAEYLVEDGPRFYTTIASLPYDDQATVREFIRDNPPSESLDHILGSAAFVAERPMVEELLRKVRAADAVDSIQIPDLRDPSEPAWLTLDLYETNVNGDFMANLTEYLEGVPSAARALELYRELQATLRTLGLNLGDKTEDDFTKGLLGAGKEYLTVPMGQPAGEDGLVDASHTLSMDIANGTFVVNCSMRVHANDIADRWDEVKTIASLTGEDDTLMAFAKEYARRENEERAKTIIKERKP